MIYRNKLMLTGNTFGILKQRAKARTMKQVLEYHITYIEVYIHICVYSIEMAIIINSPKAK